MKHTASLLVFAGLLAAGGTASAHHSFAAAYKTGETVTVEGDLVQFLFRNPHSFIHLIATNKDGTRVRYAVEWGGAGQLGGQGVTRETLKPGDHVVVTGTPGRNASVHWIRMTTLRRPKDGFVWGERPGEVVE